MVDLLIAHGLYIKEWLDLGDEETKKRHKEKKISNRCLSSLQNYKLLQYCMVSCIKEAEEEKIKKLDENGDPILDEEGYPVETDELRYTEKEIKDLTYDIALFPSKIEQIIIGHYCPPIINNLKQADFDEFEKNPWGNKKDTPKNSLVSG